MSKTLNFEAIKQAFASRDHAKLSQGQLPMRSTQVGFWGVSNLDDVYNWFEAMEFAPTTRFIDLGCGDGRVVAVASLFVHASGVEYDEELVLEGRSILSELGVDAQLIAGDMRSLDFSSYDVLYMYADQNFLFLKQKLQKELSGTLFLYHDTYHPDFLRKGKITWVGQIPIYAYTRRDVPIPQE